MNENEELSQNPNFQKWFANSKLLDEDGNPIVLYHGTTSEFYSFNLSKTNAEGFAGMGFYFSSSSDDAYENYSLFTSPDLKSKRDKFIEDIENYVDKENEDYVDEDGSVAESKARFEELVQETTENDSLSYLEKVDVLINYINGDSLILIEGKDDNYLKEIFNKVIQFKEEGIVHPVYIKMENPFYLERQTWEQNFDVDDDIKNIFNEFIKRNESSDNNQPQELINHLLDSIQHYCNVESENYLTIDKESFFNSIDVSLSDLDDDDWEHYEYPLSLLRDLASYWDNAIGEEEYLSGNFTMNDIASQFKNYVINEYGDVLCGRDIDRLNEIYFESHESVSGVDLHEKIMSLDFLYDYSSENIHINNVFANFIYHLGFDGIVHEANRFKNMQHIDETLHYILRNPNNIKLADGNNIDFSLSNDDIRYKKVEKPEVKISYEDAFNIIEKFHLKYPNLPYTKIFHTQKDADKYIKTKESVAGFYIEQDKPVVGIVLENISNSYHLQKTLFHEHLGHASLRDILGNQYQPTMMGIYNYLVKHDEIKPSPEYNVSKKLELAEEYFANSMENPNSHTPKLFAKIQAAVSSAIRKIFPEFPFTKAEVSILQNKTIKNAVKPTENLFTQLVKKIKP